MASCIVRWVFAKRYLPWSNCRRCRSAQQVSLCLFLFHISYRHLFLYSRSPDTVTVLTTFCYNVEPALVMKPENMFALAIASRSGQFHGVVALLSVMMYHLKRRSVYLSTLIGDIPAMAELMNRCGHAKKQACPKCKLAGDTFLTSQKTQVRLTLSSGRVLASSRVRQSSGRLQRSIGLFISGQSLLK